MMYDRSVTRPNRSVASARMKLLCGCALGVALPLFAQPARADGFNASFDTPTVFTTGGTVTIDRSVTNLDTITIGSGRATGVTDVKAVINWTPTDRGTGGGEINFLPSVASALFENSGTVTNFTVLNRILPTDRSRPIRFDGTVTSRINGTPGGNIFFFSPGGIVASSSAVFDVGSLILTALDIDTSDGLEFNTVKALNFQQAEFANAAINIDGASLTGSGNGSYLALVAPQIIQAGNVSFDGPIAYTAAEGVSMLIDQGLFSMTFTAGTGVGDAIVHTGTTGGSAVGSGDRRIYFASVPKNMAITNLLVGGSIGYTPAAEASLVDGAIVLSAGFNIDDAGGPQASQFVTSGLASVKIGDFENGYGSGNSVFSDLVRANATGDIDISPVSDGSLSFDSGAEFTAGRRVSLVAAQDETIDSGGSLFITSRNALAGAGAFVEALSESGYGAPGTINIGGSLFINGGTAVMDGGALRKGTAALSIDGGIVDVGGIISIDTSDTDRNAPGLGIGGNSSLSFVNDGTLSASELFLSANANSADRDDLASGGSTSLTIDSGNFTVGQLGLSSNGMAVEGGVARGGDTTLTITGGAVSFGGVSLSANAGVLRGRIAAARAPVGGGDGAQGDPGPLSPALQGGTARLTISNVDVTMGQLIVRANADAAISAEGGGLGAGAGDIVGGNALVEVNSGSLTVTDLVFLEAGAFGSGVDGNADTDFAVGGTAKITANGVPITAGTIFLNASGIGANGALVGGSGFGGTAALETRNGGSISTTGGFNSIDAYGIGGSGQIGGDGFGGTVNIDTNNGLITLPGQTNLFAYGIGGSARSNLFGLTGNRSGTGEGGTVNVNLGFVGETGSAQHFTSGTLRAEALGLLETGYGNGQPGGDGGDGRGGTINFRQMSGISTIDSLVLVADGEGEGQIGQNTFRAGAGGDAFGGTVNFSVIGGEGRYRNLMASTGALGGDAGAGPAGTTAMAAGNATGGTINASVSGGMLTSEEARFTVVTRGGTGASDNNLVNSGAGGNASGGSANFSLAGTGQLNFDARASGDRLLLTGLAVGGDGGTATSGTGGAGGSGTGATLGFTYTTSAAQVSVPDINLSSSGNGGDGGGTDQGSGGIGGNGTGGAVSFDILGGNAELGNLSLFATGTGGRGGAEAGYGSAASIGGKGGAGTGGTARLFVDRDSDVANVTIEANATGGNGGFAAIGGAAGSGTGGVASYLSTSDISITDISIGANGEGGIAAGAGGSGTGGTARFEATDGVSTIGSLTVFANGIGSRGADGVDSNSIFDGGNGGAGGSGNGGLADILITGSNTVVTTGSLALQSIANGGDGGSGGDGAISGEGMTSPGDGGNGGDALSSGIARLTVDNSARLNVTSTSGLLINARGLSGVGGLGGNQPFGGTGGNFGRGGTGSGGSARLLLDGGGILSVSSMILDASGLGGGAETGYGSGGGSGSGGLAEAQIASGTLLADRITIVSRGVGASGFDGSSRANGTAGGNAQGGRVRLIAGDAPGFSGPITLDAQTFGGAGGSLDDTGGRGGDAFAGSVDLLLSGAGSGLVTTINLGLTGGAGGMGGGRGGDGGDAFRGSLGSLLTVSGNGVISPSLVINGASVGGSGGSGGAGNGGNGGSTSGPTVTLSVQGADTIMTSSGILFDLSSTGGAGGAGGVSGTFPGSGNGGFGGGALGGEGVVFADGGATVSLSDISLFADAFGGVGGAGGIGSTGGFGGFAVGGTIQLFGFRDSVINGGNFALAITGTGGAGGRGGVGETGVQGDGGTDGTAGQVGGTGLTGGTGQTGGAGGGGGLGIGGRVFVFGLAGSTINFDNLSLTLNGVGGLGGAGENGGNGGQGGFGGRGGDGADGAFGANGQDGGRGGNGGMGGLGGLGGDAGRGGDGFGGTGDIFIQDGALTVGSLSIAADSFKGLSGAAGVGGVGGAGGESGYGGTGGEAGYGGLRGNDGASGTTGLGGANGLSGNPFCCEFNMGRGGNIIIEVERTDAADENAVAIIGSTFLTARTDGAGEGGEIIFKATRPGDEAPILRLGSIFADAQSGFGGRIMFEAGDTTIEVDGDANLFTSGEFAARVSDRGRVLVGGNLNVFADFANISHEGRNAAADTITAQNIEIRAFDFIDAFAGARIRSLSSFGIFMQTDAGSIFADDLRSAGDILLSAGGDIGLKDAETTGPAFALPGRIEGGLITLFAGNNRLGIPGGDFLNSNTTINGSLTASGALSIRAGGDVIIGPDANIASDNFVVIGSGDDIIVNDGAIIRAALDLAPDTGYGSFGQLQLEAGVLSSIVGRDPADVSSIVVGNASFSATGQNILLIAEAIQAPDASFATNRFFASIVNAPAFGVAGRNDGGLLTPACVEGNMCFGAITAPSSVTMRGGNIISLSPAAILSSNVINLSARDLLAVGDGASLISAGPISLATEGLLSLGTGARVEGDGSVSVTAGQLTLQENARLAAGGDVSVFVTDALSGSGRVGLTEALISGDNVRVFAVNGIDGNGGNAGSIEARSIAALGTNGSIGLSSLRSGFSLNTIDETGAVTVDGTLRVPDVVLIGTLSISDGDANIEAASIIVDDAFATNNINLSGGTVTLFSGNAGSINLNAGGSVFGGFLDAGTQIVLSGSDAQFTDLISSGSISVTGSSGDVRGNNARAETSIDIRAGNFADLGNITSRIGDVSIQAATGIFTGNLTASSGSVSLDNDSGDITTGLIDASGDFELANGGSFTLGDVTAGGNAFIVTRGAGGSLGTVNAGAIGIAGSSITATLLDADDDILVVAGFTNIGSASAGDDLQISTTGPIFLGNGATRGASADSTTLVFSGGAFSLNSTAADGSDITLTSNANINVGTLAASNDISANAGTGFLATGLLQTFGQGGFGKGDIALSSTTNLISLADVNATGNFTATGLALTASGRIEAREDVRLTASSNIATGNIVSGDDLVVSGGALSLGTLMGTSNGPDAEADGRNIALTGNRVSLVSADAVGSLTIVATVAEIVATGTLSAGNNISLTGTGLGIDIADADAFGNLALTAIGSGSVRTGNLEAGDLLTVTSTDQAILGDLTANFGSIVVTAPNAISTGTIDSQGDASLTTTMGPVTTAAVTVRDDFTVVSGGLTTLGPVIAGDDIRITSSSVVNVSSLTTDTRGQGDDAGGRDIVVSALGVLLGAATSAGAIDLSGTTAGGVTVSGALSSFDFTNVSGNTLALAAIDAGGAITLTSTAGAITAGALSGSSVTADSATTLTAGDVLARDTDIALTAGTALTGGDLTAARGSITLSNGIVDTGNVITTGLITAANDFNLTTGSSFDFAGVSVGDDIRITTGNNASLGRLITTGVGTDEEGDGSNIVLTIGGNATVTHAESDNDFTATATNFTTGLNSIIAGGDISIATSGDSDLGNSTAGGFIRVDAGGRIDFADLVSDGDTSLVAGGTVIGNSVNSQANIALQNRSTALISAGTLRADGDILLNSRGAASIGSADAVGEIAILYGADFSFGTLRAGENIGLAERNAPLANVSGGTADAGTDFSVRSGNFTTTGGITAGTDVNLRSAAVDIGGPLSAGNDFNVRADSVRTRGTLTTGRDANFGIIDATLFDGLVQTGADLNIITGSATAAANIITGNDLNVRADSVRTRGTLTIGNDATLTIAGATLFEGLVQTTRDFNVSTGSATATANIVAGNDAGIFAAGPISVLDVSAGRDIDFRADADLAARNLVASTGMISLMAGGTIANGNATAGGNIGLASLGGTIVTGNLGGTSVAIDSATTLNAANIVATSNDIGIVTVGAITTGDLTANQGSLSLTNDLGTITTGSIAVRNDFTLGTGSDLNFAGITVGDDIRITTGGNASLGTLITRGTGTDNETDGRNIVLAIGGNATVTHAESDNDFTATATNFTTGLNSIVTMGDIDIATSGDSDLGNSTAGGFIRVDAGGMIDFVSLNAGGFTSLTAGTDINGGSVISTSAITTSAGDALTLTQAANSFGNITLGGASATIANLAAAQDLVVSTTTGNIVQTGTASARRDIRITAANGLTAASLEAGRRIALVGSDVTVTIARTTGIFSESGYGGPALNSDIVINSSGSQSLGTLNAFNNIFLSADGAIAGSSLTAGDNIFAVAEGNLTLGGVSAGDMLGVRGDNVTATGNWSAGEDILIIDQEPAAALALGTLDLTAGDDITVMAINGGISIASATTTGLGRDGRALSFGRDFTIGGGTPNGADITLTTSAANANIIADTLNAADDIVVDSTGSITIDTVARTRGIGNTGGASDIVLRSSGILTVANAQAFDSVSALSVGNVDLGQGNAGLDFTVISSAGTITQTGTINADRNLFYGANGAIAVTGTVSAGREVSIAGGGNVSLANAITTGQFDETGYGGSSATDSNILINANGTATIGTADAFNSVFIDAASLAATNLIAGDNVFATATGNATIASIDAGAMIGVRGMQVTGSGTWRAGEDILIIDRQPDIGANTSTLATLIAGDDIDVRSDSGSVTVGDLTTTGSGSDNRSIRFTTGFFTEASGANGSDITLTTVPGGTSITTGVLSAADDVIILAQTSIATGNVTAADAISLTTMSGGINTGNLTGAGVSVNSATTLASGNIVATSGNIGITTVGAITTGDLAANMGSVSLTNGLGMIETGLIMVGNDFTLVTDSDLNFAGVSVGDDIRITTDGNADLGNLTTRGTGTDHETDGSNIVLTIGRNATLTHADSAGDFTATAARFETGLNSIDTDGDIAITTSGDALLGNSRAGGFIDVDAGGLIDYASLSAGEFTSLDAGNTITGGTSTSSGGFSAFGANGVNLTSVTSGPSLSIGSNGGTLNVGTATTSGNIDLTHNGAGALIAGSLTADGDINVFSNGSAAIASATARGTFSIDPPLIADGNIFVIASGAVTLDAASARTMIGVTGASVSGNGDWNAGEDILVEVGGAANLVNLTAGDDLDVIANAITLGNGTASGTARDDRSIFLERGYGTFFRISSVEPDGSNIGLISSGGDITATNLTAAGDILADATGAVAISGAALAGLSIDILAGGNVTVAGATSTGDGIEVEAGGTVVAGTLRAAQSVAIEADGDVTVTSATASLQPPPPGEIKGFGVVSGGNIVVGSGTADNIVLGALGNVSATTLTASNAVGLFAGGAVTLGTVTALGDFYIGNASVLRDIGGLDGIDPADLPTLPLTPIGGAATVIGQLSARSIRVAAASANFARSTSATDTTVAVSGTASLGASTAGRNAVLTAGGLLSASDLRAGGTVDARGGAINIFGGAGLNFVRAEARLGDLSIVTAGPLTVQAALSANDARITTTGSGANLIVNSVDAGDDIFITSGGSATLGTVVTRGAAIDGIDRQPDGSNIAVTAATTIGYTSFNAINSLTLTAGGGITGGNASAGNSFDFIAGGTSMLGALTAGGQLTGRTSAGNLTTSDVLGGFGVDLTSAGALATGNVTATAGDVELVAGTALGTGNISAAAGSISLTNGAVPLITGTLLARDDFTLITGSSLDFAGISVGDDISITTAGDATLGALVTTGMGTDRENNRGNVTLAIGGALTAMTIDSHGAIIANATGAIATGNLDADTRIAVSSSGGAVAVANVESLGGAVAITANGLMTTGNIRAASAINLTGTAAITAGNLTAGTGPLIAGGGFGGGGGTDAAPSGIAPGFDDVLFFRNDDAATGAIALPFSLNFFGVNRSQTFVSNNGYLTFNTGQGTFTPSGLGTGYSGQPIIAAFFADVDTRNPASAQVAYGPGTFAGRTAFGATYENVGYFPSRADKLNSFQIILTDRVDTGAGNFDIYYNYTGIRWETGSASGGTNGFGGVSAAVGFNAGTGNQPGTFFELPGSRIPGSFLDNGPRALITGTNNGTPGQLLFVVRNGQVMAGGMADVPGVRVTNIATGNTGNVTLGNLSGELVNVRSAGSVTMGNSDVGDRGSGISGSDRLTTSIEAATSVTAGDVAGTGAVALRANGGALAVGSATSGASLIGVATGALSFARESSAATSVALTGGSITLAAPISAGTTLSASANGIVNLARANAGGNATLASATDTVTVADLRSGGTVDARGTALAINGGAALAFSIANASSGDVALTTVGALSVDTSSAGRDTSLTSSTDSITLGTNVDAARALAIRAATNAAINGAALGATVEIRSANIAIANTAQVGAQGRTSRVTLANSGNALTTIGGSGVTTGYSLSNGEAQRVFGTDIFILAPRVTAAQGSTGQVSVVLDTLTLTGANGQSGATTGNIGSSGRLRIETAGKLRTVGSVTINNLGSGNRFEIAAAEAIEVDAATGSIALRNASDGLGGTLVLTSQDVIAASSMAMSDVASATTLAAINDRLAINDGMPNDDGALRADGIIVNVSNGFYVQNSGVTSTNPRNFNDRRGLTVGSGGLQINIASQSTSGTPGTVRIVINGRQIGMATGTGTGTGTGTTTGTTPGFLTGLDFLRQVRINDGSVAMGNLQTGLFDAGSTINGCAIVSVLSCSFVAGGSSDPTNIARDIIDELDEVLGEDAQGKATLRLPSMLIQIKDTEELSYQPVIDDPVTGSGNDDLFAIDDGKECDPKKEGDCPAPKQ